MSCFKVKNENYIWLLLIILIVFLFFWGDQSGTLQISDLKIGGLTDQEWWPFTTETDLGQETTTTDQETETDHEPPPEQPSAPFITLSANPKSISKGGSTTLTVTSNFINQPIELIDREPLSGSWVSQGTRNTGSGGGLQQPMQIQDAGFWKFKAQKGGTVSNIEEVAAEGLTLYHQQDNLALAEAWYGAVTGTYRNWVVHLFIKRSSVANWDLVTRDRTGSDGILPYERFGAFPFSFLVQMYCQANKDYNLIAVIDLDDSDGLEFDEIMFGYNYQGIPLSALGDRVESNILTIHVTP